MTQDAFAHLPHLRDRITPADESELRATRNALAAWDELANKAGYPPTWRRSEQEIEASRRAFLGDVNADQDFWVFGYGSLMWDPSFHFAEVRLADVEGYQRRFTFKSKIARGSRDHPALMLSLEQQAGTCRGLAFRIPADLAGAELEILWRREMIAGSYAPLIVSMTTPQGNIRALVFASNTSHPNYVGDLPLSETAAIIATGVGAIGTNRDCLEQMAAQLKILEIEDPYVEQLLKQVRKAPAA